MKHTSLIISRQINTTILLACISILIYSCNKDQVSLSIDNNTQDIESLKIEVIGDSVTLGQAENIAKIFSTTKRTKSNSVIEIKNSFVITENEEKLSKIYVINFTDNNGFVIVGSSKKYAPILGYSEKGYFEQQYQNKPISFWLKEQLKNIELYRTSPDSIKFQSEWMQFEKYAINTHFKTRSESLNSVRDAFIAEWESRGYRCYPLNEQPGDLPDDIYNSFCQIAEGCANQDYDYMTCSVILEFRTNTSNVDTGILLNTSWDQQGAYNDSIPNGNPVGCTAVAVAQIMKYHQVPVHYSWSSMDDNYATPATQSFLAEVHDEINWRIAQEISDPWSARNYLRDNGYSNANVQTHGIYDVQDNLILRRPVLMSGADGLSGHSWVCDGFRTSSYNKEYFLYVVSVIPPLQYENTAVSHSVSYGSGNYYHMNWGWGGQYDGWYFGDVANPNNYNFNWLRTEVIDIYPSN